ncbi:hypothetical protein BGX38DRAFT_830246 [Terfezia claveryi]|nr:hypothetical protein BGX38DRAFT_830246 [Terfezia claveryi]
MEQNLSLVNFEPGQKTAQSSADFINMIFITNTRAQRFRYAYMLSTVKGEGTGTYICNVLTARLVSDCFRLHGNLGSDKARAVQSMHCTESIHSPDVHTYALGEENSPASRPKLFSKQHTHRVPQPGPCLSYQAHSSNMRS